MATAVLSINESDPSGGAGLHADLKTFHQHGLYGMAVVSQLTVQNTQSMFRAEPVEARFVIAQLDAVLSDIKPAAVKTGALGSVETIEAVAERAARLECALVVDPNLITRDGAHHDGEDRFTAMREHLLPRAFLLTANLDEAASLLGRGRIDDGEQEDAARALAALGPKHVVVKGDPARPRVVDVLYGDGHAHRLSAERIHSTARHGTGCVFSAAITSRLAQRMPPDEAVVEAKKFITAAIRTQPGLGYGSGPVNMHAGV